MFDDSALQLRVQLFIIIIIISTWAVVMLSAVVVDVSDAAVVRARGQRVHYVQRQLVVRVASASTARRHEHRSVSALDEVTARLDVRQNTAEPVVQWVVAVSQ